MKKEGRGKQEERRKEEEGNKKGIRREAGRKKLITCYC